LKILLTILGLALSTNLYAETNAPLRVQLHWTHQAQFAGYYLAESRLSQSPEAIRVKLLEGGPGINPINKLLKNQADVGIAWVSELLDARKKGADVVNVAQIFRRPGMAVAFNKRAGLKSVSNLVGHSVGVWNVGDEISVRLWLRNAGIPESSVRLVQQAGGAKDLISGKVNCATVMVYNEYWNLVESGFKPDDLLVTKFGDVGLGMLEDGIYVKRANLDDPNFRRRLTEFLRAMAAGWQQAREHPDEAVAITMTKSRTLEVAHQRRMLDSILNLIPADKPFGFLEPADFERTVNIYAGKAHDAEEIRKLGRAAWTHRIWEEAGLSGR